MKSKKYTLRAAIAWSPTNKAYAAMPEGDTCIVRQRDSSSYYGVLMVPENGMGIEEWLCSVREIENRSGVDPDAQIWTPMGVQADPSDWQAALLLQEREALQETSKEGYSFKYELFRGGTVVSGCFGKAATIAQVEEALRQAQAYLAKKEEERQER